MFFGQVVTISYSFFRNQYFFFCVCVCNNLRNQIITFFFLGFFASPLIFPREEKFKEEKTIENKLMYNHDISGKTLNSTQLDKIIFKILYLQIRH